MFVKNLKNFLQIMNDHGARVVETPIKIENNYGDIFQAVQNFVCQKRLARSFHAYQNTIFIERRKIPRKQLNRLA